MLPGQAEGQSLQGWRMVSEEGTTGESGVHRPCGEGRRLGDSRTGIGGTDIWIQGYT